MMSLLCAAKKVAHAASRDADRENLRAIRFEVRSPTEPLLSDPDAEGLLPSTDNEAKTIVVATDGHRLAVAFSTDALPPRMTAATVSFKKQPEELWLMLDERVMTAGDGAFPNWRRVVPSTATASIRVSKESLLSALKRIVAASKLADRKAALEHELKLIDLEEKAARAWREKVLAESDANRDAIEWMRIGPPIVRSSSKVIELRGAYGRAKDAVTGWKKKAPGGGQAPCKLSVDDAGRFYLQNDVFISDPLLVEITGDWPAVVKETKSGAVAISERYLLAAVKTAAGARVRLDFIDVSSPIVVRGAGPDREMIMPMRID